MSAPPATRRVAFEGQAGAHSESVGLALFANEPSLRAGLPVETVGYETFDKLFEAVAQGQAQFGILPLENSITGTFYKVLDLLHQHSLHIVGETIRHEQHSLVAMPGVTMEQITEIRSHPFAIEQCRTFLSSLGKHVAIGQALDTAASAAEIKAKNLTFTAAIADARAAELYGLSVLQRGIEDDPNNVTRYVLVAREPVIPQRHTDPRTTLSVGLKNQTGAFFKALSVFALREINICKIESRPSPRSIRLAKPWEYILYIDVDGSIADPPISNALRHLQELAIVRVLGSYPRFQHQAAQQSSPIYGIGM
ncbi:Prephenate dehydratase-domain-containing protein [Entophlyctis helioformis]|nr:Prephenate dehydratase-domain-containing protein [Entophlyctis helioformis]